VPYELWHEISLTLGGTVGLLTFVRGQEQRRDNDFQEIGARLSSPTAAMLRATAARQLPKYFAYRRFGLFWRPYRLTAVSLALDALKVKPEEKFVRQALVEALKTMLSRCVSRDFENQSFTLIDANLDELIMYKFPFDRIDLTNASLQRADLGGATFRQSKLWKADLTHSKLASADLTGANLWDTNLSRCNLKDATIVTPYVNDLTKFEGADLMNARLSIEVAQICDLRDQVGYTITGPSKGREAGRS
jgi:pentapeptide repeat protein